ncbi:hypothetical protein N9Q08_05230 [Schleiferiaceae bacterium]|nr:hypothetical protein [Schleiferiaceae bacterium]MDA9287114.1 hypothetical protein [Schleiferiaceae bacterium]
MKNLFRALLLCTFTVSLNAQPYSLTIGNYPIANLAAYANLEQPAVIQGVVTIAVTTNQSGDVVADASLSSLVLEGGGNYITADADLIIDGSGIDQIVMDYDVVQNVTGGRTITITNTDKVHFNGGVFKSSGSNGPITLVIGDDGMSSTGVTTLEFDEEPVLNGGTYRIAAGTIIDDIGVTFPAIDASNYSKVKYTTWSSSSTGTPTFQTYVPNDGDKMICSPTDEGFKTVSASNSSGAVTLTKGNLYTFDASTGNWATNPNTATLETPGKGFFGFVGSGTNTTGTFLASSPAIVSFDGTPNATHTPSLDNATTTASGGSGDGWNLIGNPFPATLEWSTVSLTNVNNAIYIWDPSTEKYNYNVTGVSAPTGSYAGSTITNVPPMQSFWVQANASSPSIGALSSATNTTFKSSPTVYKTMPDNIIVKLSNQSDSADQDAFWLKNVINTSMAFEGAEDAWKYKNPNSTNIFTTDTVDEAIAINSVDLYSNNFIPFTIEPVSTSGFKVEVEEVVTGATAYQIYLLDLDKSDSYDLKSAPVNLSLDSGVVYDDRFALFVTTSSTVGMEDILKPELDWTAIVVSGGIKVTADYDYVEYELLDLSGRLLSKGTFSYESVIPYLSSNATMILKINTINGTGVKKIAVQK